MYTEEKSSLTERIREHGLGRYLYILPVLVSYFILAYVFNSIYWPFARYEDEIARYPLWFNIGWSVLLTGIVMLLPAILKKIFMLLSIAAYSLIAIASGVMLNMFGRFFSFADLYFADDGAAFMDISYLEIRKLIVAVCILCIALMVLAVILAPKRRKAYTKAGTIAAVIFLAVGVSVCLMTKSTIAKQADCFSWDAGMLPEEDYQKYGDTVKSLLISGIYEYSFRDLYLTTGWFSKPTKNELQSIADYAASRPEHTANEMSGIFEGKNLIMIQLESIDKWTLTEDYMPNLYALKSRSIEFTDHYAPVYISAGTFNTEFMANTSLFPALTGTSSAIYTKNAFPNCLPALMEKAGYTANSFHHSDRVIYDRGNIHENLGYERYVNYVDMEMEDTFLDTELMRGYDEMVKADKFFSFVITISGHGPFTEATSASARHIDKARELSDRSEPGCIQAIAQAMETDEFIGQLVSALERDGLMDDTVLVFYADHYNYYLHDDELCMELKGEPNENLLSHVDFFIYSRDTEPMKTDKVTTSLDILPTLANMFALDADYSMLLGNDAFGSEEGYVFFQDGSWYDGSIYRDSTTALDEYIASVDRDIKLRSSIGQLILKCDYFAFSEENG